MDVLSRRDAGRREVSQHRAGPAINRFRLFLSQAINKKRAGLLWLSGKDKRSGAPSGYVASPLKAATRHAGTQATAPGTLRPSAFVLCDRGAAPLPRFSPVARPLLPHPALARSRGRPRPAGSNGPKVRTARATGRSGRIVSETAVSPTPARLGAPSWVRAIVRANPQRASFASRVRHVRFIGRAGILGTFRRVFPGAVYRVNN